MLCIAANFRREFVIGDLRMVICHLLIRENMTLASGSKLGPYEIISPIGAGGMGEVYRAHDPRVGRDVAIKISAEQFGERFEREARAVAALNHSNICTLHDVGPNYLVMELVEGLTLQERIAEGGIPLDEALAIARQIADALEARTRKGSSIGISSLATSRSSRTAP